MIDILMLVAFLLFTVIVVREPRYTWPWKLAIIGSACIFGLLTYLVYAIAERNHRKKLTALTQGEPNEI